ncbi:MAG: DoxX family protein [Cyclobacteriaceae bacterium]|nr:DoxX family protein [Cyclobacteriaceae bacterium HetDA_MAG_MS6]
MKILTKVNLVLLLLLSISTGAVKLNQMPEEMALFRGAGFSDSVTVFLGVIQLIGGLALIPAVSRKWGALLMSLTFLIATVVVFINGMIGFGLFSILFIIMAGWVYKNPVTLFNSSI